MISGKTTHLTLQEFYAWLSKARPGARICYAIGDLACDRQQGFIEKSGLAFPLHDLAKMAFHRCENGDVHLLQRKLSEGVWEYIAIKADYGLRSKKALRELRMA